MVATPVFEDDQAFDAAAVAEPLNWVVEPTHTARVPLIVGSGLTVTMAVCWQPLLLVYVIVDVPALTPVTNPVAEIVATPMLDDDQAFDAAAVAEPLNSVVEPTHTLRVPVIDGRGLTVIIAVFWHPLLLV
jgi:hypothetical protein